MTQNEQKLESVTNQIQATDPRARALYTALLGLLHMKAKVELEATTSLEWQTSNHVSPQCSPIDAANHFEYFWARGGGNELVQLAKLHAALATLEAMPECQAAREHLAPLVAERDRLAEAIRAEAAAIAAARSAAEAAHQAAVERAQAAAAADPQVLEARRKLAAFESQPEAPPPLVRGRQRLPVEQLAVAD
ncbi:MAG: hypothetical protein NTW21_43940 [Verrucomicrobia bacterium]|nr:hypothetical protein [Verrucomicrobiota bacterium]